MCSIVIELSEIGSLGLAHSSKVKSYTTRNVFYKKYGKERKKRTLHGPGYKAGKRSGEKSRGLAGRRCRGIRSAHAGELKRERRLFESLSFAPRREL